MNTAGQGAVDGVRAEVLSKRPAVGSAEISLKRVFLHSQEGLSGMEHVSIEVRTD
jgi:hypothetical protein